MQNVNIYLENGEVLQAKTNCVHDFITGGELVFTTAMTGYQEIITDPSFAGQIIVMTYPLIGNYGVDFSVSQSEQIYAKGMIVQNIDNNNNFEDFLQKNNITLIHSINTRDVVHLIKNLNYPKCVISNQDLTKEQIEEYSRKINPNVFDQISVKQIEYTKGFIKNSKKIGIFDFGIKKNIINETKNYFEDVFILPFDTKLKQILDLKLDSILLSNGPGDPDRMQEVIKNIKTLLGKINIYGICLGHQLLGLALGCQTKAMEFGHRGANHPVMNLQTGKIIITSQNHGYEIVKDSMPNNVKITHINLHDQSIEGIESTEYVAKSVQFHPEACPGPADAKIIFKNWFCNSNLN